MRATAVEALGSTTSGRAISHHPLQAVIYEPSAAPTTLRSFPGPRSATADRSPGPIQNELEQFDIRTGAVLGPPAGQALKTFPVRVTGADIEIEV
jgi:hypothetical protein